MKKSRISEPQIMRILKENESGISVPDLARKYGVSAGTNYNWRSKYGGMESSDLKRLKELEREHNRLKKMFADLSMENHALRDVIEKKL